MKLIAITGGIGSGKSVVARMVQVMGYQVYDCDSRAKALMTEDDNVRHQLVDAFGPETFLEDGSLNRQHLSAAAFGNDESLSRPIVVPQSPLSKQHCCARQDWTGWWTKCGM